MKFLFVLLLGVFCVAGEPRVTYEGYTVYRVTPKSQEHNEILLTLENESNKLDFWTRANPASMPVHVMVAPADQKAFLNIVNSNGMGLEVFIQDVQERISLERMSDSRGSMDWTDYHTLESIYDWLDVIAEENPETVTIVNGGSSFEGREIKGVKISFGSGKRSVLIEGTHHAREWITTATVTYIINDLLTSTDPELRRIAESFDWYLFPVTNPDGYVYSFTTDRLWRKTRTIYGPCDGADPNRNWDVNWGLAGTSNLTCSNTYGGPEPFSEIETRTFADFINTIGSTIDVFLSMHSFSQMFLIPYGHTTAPLDNFEDVDFIGQKAVIAIAKKHNTRYTSGNFAQVLYPASGTTLDWVKKTHEVPIAILYELRDTGTHGFVLPPSQILPNCEEVIDSIISIIEEGSLLGYFPLNELK